jgi:hypothetical protein
MNTEEESEGTSYKNKLWYDKINHKTSTQRNKTL